MNRKKIRWLPWIAAVGAHGFLFAFVQTNVAGSSFAPAKTLVQPTFVGAILTPSSLTIPDASTSAEKSLTQPPMLPVKPIGALTQIPFQPEVAEPKNISSIHEELLPPKLFGAEKQYPHAVTTVVPPKSVSNTVWIRGPALRRELVQRPPIADFMNQVRLTRLRSQEIAGRVEIELKFTLMMNGEVDRVEVLRSSGDPLLDVLGSQYLKEWKFSALDPQDVRIHNDSWGRAVLRLDLESSENDS